MVDQRVSAWDAVFRCMIRHNPNVVEGDGTATEMIVAEIDRVYAAIERLRGLLRRVVDEVPMWDEGVDGGELGNLIEAELGTADQPSACTCGSEWHHSNDCPQNTYTHGTAVKP